MMNFKYENFELTALSCWIIVSILNVEKVTHEKTILIVSIYTN